MITARSNTTPPTELTIVTIKSEVGWSAGGEETKGEKTITRKPVRHLPPFNTTTQDGLAGHTSYTTPLL